MPLWTGENKSLSRCRGLGCFDRLSKMLLREEANASTKTDLPLERATCVRTPLL